MAYEEDDGIIPPFPAHVKSLTGGVLVTGILAVSALTSRHWSNLLEWNLL